MKQRHILVATLTILAVAGLSQANTTMLFTPNPADLNDLDHTLVYRWGFNVSLPAGEQAISATLTLHNISNWDNNPNVLYIHLLNNASLGVATNADSENGGDYFVTAYTSTQTHLVTYQNLTTTAHTLTYNFTADELAALNSYAADGRIGLGFDPDCHFYNSGVNLQIVTPEPAMWVLLIGTIPMLLRRRTRA